MPLSTFLFDLDGTLIDSLEDIAAALDRALVDHGLPTPTRARAKRSGATRIGLRPVRCSCPMIR